MTWILFGHFFFHLLVQETVLSGFGRPRQRDGRSFAIGTQLVAQFWLWTVSNADWLSHSSTETACTVGRLHALECDTRLIEFSCSFHSLFLYIEIYSPKRGVDFGLGRGYSGSQAAKHLMGLAAANYAVGPGRKRRDAAEPVKADAIN